MGQELNIGGNDSTIYVGQEDKQQEQQLNSNNTSIDCISTAIEDQYNTKGPSENITPPTISPFKKMTTDSQQDNDEDEDDQESYEVVDLNDDHVKDKNHNDSQFVQKKPVISHKKIFNLQQKNGSSISSFDSLDKSLELPIIELLSQQDSTNEEGFPATPNSMAASNQSNMDINSSVDSVSSPESSSANSSRTNTFVQEELSQKKILIIFSGLMMSLFLCSLDMTIVATALPAIVNDMGSLEQLSWIVTIYLLTSTSVSPLFGKFSDIFGRKTMLLTSLIIFCIGSLLCAVSTTIDMLIVSRGVQGIGGGGLMSAVMIVMAEIVPLRQRGKYQGLLGAVYAVSSVVGPLMGGTFTDNVNWRWAFWINLPICAIAFAIVFFALKIPQEVIPFREGIKRIDIIGTTSLVSAVVSFLLALSWGGQDYQWSSPVIICLFVGTAIFVGIFIINEKFFAAYPVIPLGLFTNRNYIICSISSFLLGFIMFGVIYYIPLYFQMVKSESATYSGLQLLPTMLGIVIFGCISGLLITKFGHYKTYPIVGMLMMTIGIFLLSLWNDKSTQSHYIGYQCIIGIGIGLTMQILVLIVQNSVDYKFISISTATISFFRTIGGVVSVAVFSAILNQQFQNNLNDLVAKDSMILNGLTASDFHAKELPTFEGYGRTDVVGAYSRALSIVFLSATPFAALGCVLTLFIQPLKLRTTLGPQKPSISTTNNESNENTIITNDGVDNNAQNNDAAADGATATEKNNIEMLEIVTVIDENPSKSENEEIYNSSNNNQTQPTHQLNQPIYNSHKCIEIEPIGV
ncbi:hypothetical protein CYY_000156 [Polysphondylium violaceum]|uniref:Major facilitator superfamily (MFS) profile domain-containing protein n=1 Tax=Polysphondylium violaceum TaxID=133409 RepID=A0A8J4Q2C9_9MYCE|nr:hypothetical protein CYY_000156 [Polysphondylium violaceum]